MAAAETTIIGSRPANRSRRGAILIGVLWLLIFLAFLAVALRVHLSGISESVRSTEGKAAARIVAEATLAQAAALAIAEMHSDGAVPARLFGQTETANGTGRFELVNESVRVDLNSGLEPLVTGALLASGASSNEAARLMRAIVDQRDDAAENVPPDPETPEPPATIIFRDLSEIVLVPGMPADIAIGMEELATVSSGLNGIRLDETDRVLLEAIPDLPRSALAAIDAYRDGRLDHTQLVAELGLLEYYAAENAPGWRALLEVELTTGHRESYQALISIPPDGARPYRILGWQRLDVVDGQ
ncbi:MAG: hypothetical protein ACXIVF_13570 [Rhizobiaceae bacterium]